MTVCVKVSMRERRIVTAFPLFIFASMFLRINRRWYGEIGLRRLCMQSFGAINQRRCDYVKQKHHHGAVNR